jgi:hypothetical protein
VTVDGVRIGLTGATYDDSVRASDPGDLRFLPTVATLNDQAAALRREGADFVVAVAHVTREQGYQIFRGRARTRRAETDFRPPDRSLRPSPCRRSHRLGIPLGRCRAETGTRQSEKAA